MGKGEYLGEFELVILLALAKFKHGATGREIYSEMVEATGRDVSLAAVYITLTRLGKKGYVSVSKRDDPDGGRAVKHFALEPAGGTALLEARDQFDRLWRRARLNPQLRTKRF